MILYTRRSVLLGSLGGALALSGCLQSSKSGPEKVHWDRDTCTLCSMIISDPGYTAQVRGGGENLLWKFDDIGCAVNWLNDQRWAGDLNAEFWIAHRDSGRPEPNWLVARQAQYRHGDATPMNYGYGAQQETAAFDFVALTNAILAHRPNHICASPGAVSSRPNLIKGQPG